jgi:hypothetical protein
VIEKTYDIAGRRFVQRPLVLGQVQQLLALLKGTDLPAGASSVSVMMAAGEKTSELLAVVLTEAGTSAKDKDLEETAAHLRDNLPAALAAEMVTDFLSLNAGFFEQMKAPVTPAMQPGKTMTR